MAQGSTKMVGLLRIAPFLIMLLALSSKALSGPSTPVDGTRSGTNVILALETGAHMILPKADKDGDAVISFSPALMDLGKASVEEYQYAAKLLLQEARMRGRGGVKLVVDARGVKFGLLKRFTVRDFVSGLSMFQGAKAVYILNPSASARVGLKIAKGILRTDMLRKISLVKEQQLEDDDWMATFIEPRNFPSQFGVCVCVLCHYPLFTYHSHQSSHPWQTVRPNHSPGLANYWSHYQGGWRGADSFWTSYVKQSFQPHTVVA
ncbi:unnamed protein product [Chrysoparadoxa australica]